MSENSNNINVEQLISLVSQNPCIWDKTLEKYHSRAATTEAWRNVCQLLDPRFEAMPEKEQTTYSKAILNKWRNIRDQWMKMEKKVNSKKKSGTGATAKYIYHEQLSFLKKSLANATEPCFTEDPELSVDPDDNSIEGSDTSAYVPSHTKTGSSTKAGKEGARKKAKSDMESQILTSMKEEDEDPNILFYTDSQPWMSAPPQTKTKAYTPSENEGARKKAKLDQERELLVSLEAFEDPNSLFYKSIQPWMTDFSDDERLQFQCGVLNLIKHIKQGRIYQPSVPTSSWQGSSTPQQAETLSQDFGLPVQRVISSHYSSPDQKSTEDSE